MICRLCLNDLKTEETTLLFRNAEESELVKIVAKYLLLEITENDTISSSICHECSSHLNDFHAFCKYVEERQSTLQNEFLDLKCAFDMQAEPTEPLIDINEEPLLDIKDVLVDCEPLLPTQEFNDTNEETSCILQDDDSGNLSNRKLPAKFVHHRRKSLLISKTTKAKKKSMKVVNRIKKTKESTAEDVPLSEEQIEPPEGNTEIQSKSKTDNSEGDELIAKYLPLKCDICHVPVETFAKLKAHFSREHSCQAYAVCCGRQFKKRHYLVDHIIMHLNPQHFQCKICDMNLKTKYSLQIHMQSRHSKMEDLKFACSVCGKRFVSKNTLKYHSLNHQTEKEFSCNLCDKAFVTQYRLNLHINAIHENITPHVCDYCGRKFKCKQSFKQHVANHEGKVQPPAQCSICNEWFKNKHGLKKHIKKHDDVEVECEFCGRICPTKVALKSHISYIHQKQNTLQCNYCDKAFKTKRNLEEHIAMHTGEKHNACPHCPKEFRSKANMYVHIKRDHFEEWSKKRSRAPTSLSE